MRNRAAIFCCYQLPAYLLNSIIAFSEKFDFRCHVLSFPILEEAPFVQEQHPNLVFYNKATLNRKQLLALFYSVQPAVVYIAGWIEKDYVVLAKYFKAAGVPVVMGLDNHWIHSWKQRLGAAFFNTFLRKHFTHIWIPGKPQLEYAQWLRFDPSTIMTGLYAADVDYFRQGYIPGSLSKNILFMGRLVPYKRPVELYKVFNALTSRQFSDWSLTFIGNGECRKDLIPNQRIQVLDFVQPKDILEHIKKASVFCLPSTREHWGVAVQENCAAGKLLITSDQVGAAAEYVHHGHNGFQFKSDDLDDLKKCLMLVFSMSDEHIIDFQKNSYNQPQRYTLDNWANQLFKCISEFEKKTHG
jgi:glycosyltransferase involved in cell wall biosynthesis